MPKPLPPIPTPLPQRLRNFCMELVPPLTFLCTVTIIVVLWGQHVVPVRVANTHQGDGDSMKAAIPQPPTNLVAQPAPRRTLHLSPVSTHN